MRKCMTRIAQDSQCLTLESGVQTLQATRCNDQGYDASMINKLENQTGGANCI